jgi:hypothetical protein
MSAGHDILGCMQTRALRCFCLAVTALTCLGAWGQARADDSMRCGSRLVSTGDGKDKVRTLCGEPTSVSLTGIVRTGGYGYGTYDYSYFGPAWTELPVELWTYNLGSSKLLRKLRFIGDELVEIRTEGYGY